MGLYDAHVLKMACATIITRTDHPPPAACRAGVPPPGSTGGGRRGVEPLPTDAVATPAKRKPRDATVKGQGQGHSHELHNGSAAKRSKPAELPPPPHPTPVQQQQQQQTAAATAQSSEMAPPPMLPRKRGRPRKYPLPPEQQVAIQVSAAAAPPPPTPAGGSIAGAPRPAGQQQQLMAPAAAPAAPAALHPALVAAVQQQGPLMQGMAVNLPRLHALLQQQAAAQAAPGAGGQAGLPGLWRQAQAVVLQQSLQVLERQLDAMSPPPTDQVRGAVKLLLAGTLLSPPCAHPHLPPLLALLSSNTVLRPS